ncbi:MAG: acyl carrier protein [Thermotogae bacterium]|uniref:acyl carrier protein n=1 Tax=Kosmotoga sp. TaxID=1955248 RepID=UPI000F0F7A32|nr:acyl carrier protein [Kosmotoga sp.]MBO8165983.1 acyl carrier protein [Kosmotoga sp.]MCD6159082.1 acyl carrier protein [Kosmotoga sp.]RKX51190.1 MAG: acyl carrier protein [Thermotogota bacterium]
MSPEEIFEKVREIIAEKLGIETDDIELSSDLTEDLGADSLDLVDLVMAFEDEFGIKVEDEQVENIKTVENVVSYVAKVLGADDEE